MRNPLASIKNAAYFLRMSLKDHDPEVLETLAIMEHDILESDRVIQELLDLARPKSPMRRRVKASEVAEAAIVRTGVPDSIVVVRHFEEEVPLHVDPQQMAMALSSLVQNAVQAMPGGGTLTIGYARSSGPEGISFLVADTGEGIPPETLGTIFDPLFTTKTKGTGLGLALAKTLVEMHGGKIDVEREPGKGSTFTVTIPTNKGQGA
jgi:signal transduction histidine kinase